MGRDAGARAEPGVHVTGDKVFVDYAWLSKSVHDAAIATVREARIFARAFGASPLLIAETT